MASEKEPSFIDVKVVISNLLQIEIDYHLQSFGKST